MNINTVKRNCPLFDDSESCEKIQPQRNCYKCPVASFDILKSENKILRDRCCEIEKENERSKILLGSKVLKELNPDYELEYGIVKEFENGDVLWYETITDELDGFVLRDNDGYIKRVWGTR